MAELLRLVRHSGRRSYDPCPAGRPLRTQGPILASLRCSGKVESGVLAVSVSPSRCRSTAPPPAATGRPPVSAEALPYHIDRSAQACLVTTTGIRRSPQLPLPPWCLAERTSSTDTPASTAC